MSRILPFFSWQFANAASAHPPGLAAKAAVELARSNIARYIGADEQELIFTSGATESCNMAIKGVFEKYAEKGRHLITVKTEHPAVLDCHHYLEQNGASITYLEVDTQGRLDPAALEAAIRPDTILVSVMYANNETGVIQPIETIGRICHAKNTLFFTDATQALGKRPIDVQALNIDLLAFSGHKVYAPKGIGGLFIRRKAPRVSLSEQIHGGGHERGLRSGTLNVPGIIGLSAALELFPPEESARIRRLRDQLEEGLTAMPGVHVNGSQHADERMDHVTNLCFDAVIGKQLLAGLNTELAVSSGSACTSATNEPSHVLMTMGLTETMARNSIRFSLGRMTTPGEVDFAVRFVRETVERLRRTYSSG